jgi:hypothetical protein
MAMARMDYAASVAVLFKFNLPISRLYRGTIMHLTRGVIVGWAGVECAGRFEYLDAEWLAAG